MAVRLTHTGEQVDAAVTKILADFADVSGVTAQADDVAEGKYFVDSNGILTEGTGSGGCLVKMYDGTHLLNAENVEAGEMPVYTPSKVGFTFTGWQDGNGNPVTAINDDISIYAVYTFIENSAIELSANSDITFKASPTYFVPDGIVQFSIDDGFTWTNLYKNAEVTGNPIYLRGLGNTKIAYGQNPGTAIFDWVTQGTDITFSGNIYAVLDYETTMAGNYPTMGYAALAGFFNGCPLVNTPALNHPTLSQNCYQSIFERTKITAGITLPATTLKPYCYAYMFKNCSLLSTPPVLPATVLDQYVYRGMFESCTSLTTPPALPATTLALGCYQFMFDKCSGLIDAPVLQETNIYSYAYSYMFQDCTSLESLPAIYATAINSQGCEYMFKGCSKIKVSTTQTGEYVNEYRIPATGDISSASSQGYNMFVGTGGTYTGSLTANTTYYTSNTIKTAA